MNVPPIVLNNMFEVAFYREQAEAAKSDDVKAAETLNDLENMVEEGSI